VAFNLRESSGISWTVVMVVPSSGTLTLRLLDKEPVRCQKGRLFSERTAVSLREVGERPAARAATLSAEWVDFEASPGLFAESQRWYLDGAGWAVDGSGGGGVFE
jgi:hypothetical protein